MSESRTLDDLRSHPENAGIFGDPEESPEFDSILASIKANGIWEPIAIKADGTILSGHLRKAAAARLGMKSVPVRVVDAFASYRDEVTFVVRSNTDRRQLTKGEIALAFKRLRELPKEKGGAKPKMGRPEKSSACGRDSRADEEAAKVLGIGKHEGRDLEAVFTTPGVPEELKQAVNSGAVAPTPAAKAVRTEQKRQGGEIKDASALKAVAEQPARATEHPHMQRVADESQRYQRDYRELFEVYKQLDGILTRRPLKAVIGPTEHHEFGNLIRDVALRAWREVESIQGPTNSGKQMALSVISGGKS